MPSNVQIIPEGLVGLKDTPLNIIFLSVEAADDYVVQNSDQVIISFVNNDIILDNTILRNGKSFFIKNISGDPLLIDSGGIDIDSAPNFTLNDGETIQLILVDFGEALTQFFILSYYIP